MRKRKSDAPKSAAKKTAAKSSPATPSETSSGSATLKIVETKRVAAMRANQMKKNQTTAFIDSIHRQPSGEEIEVSPSIKLGRATKSNVRRAPIMTAIPDALQSGQEKFEELKEEVEVSEVLEVVEDDLNHHREEANVTEAKELVASNVGGPGFKEQSTLAGLEVTRSGSDVNDLEQENEVSKDGEGSNKPLDVDNDCIEESGCEEVKKVDTEPVKVVDGLDEKTNKEKFDMRENKDEENSGNVDADANAVETKARHDEDREVKEIAKVRRNRKEREVFVGGLDRDATEDDVRRVFEKMGEIVEIRLHKDLSSNKNKGYAFVEYAKKEYTKRALGEMKNPVIHGKRCGTAPSEDNDTLFLGNISNTWTEEEISQKLKDYGLEGVENITLVPDLQREGFSRGFAFVEFITHADAMSAYKRLQKPDVIFGHTERTAKVAFAEPLREADPDVMAQIKSVFVDGLPPHWDEVRVREQLKNYGEIIRVCLARNMSTAKRKDFGFVDFSTHEAAMACIDGINNAQLNDENSKMKLKARLSNPMPKTQAVKGGMCGGFRIGRSDGGFPRYGRGSGRGGNHFNNAGFSRDRGFYHSGHGRMGRADFPDEYCSDIPYSDLHGRQMVGRGGRRGSFRGGHYSDGGVSRHNPGDRQRFGAPDREWGMVYPPSRQPYSPDVHFDGPFPGNHFDDPYFYGEGMHGMKRPSYMRDSDLDFVEPSRIRPRFDYTDPGAAFHGNRYHDGYESGSSLHSQDYYGPDYPDGPHSSFYRGDHHHPPYGRGYYF